MAGGGACEGDKCCGKCFSAFMGLKYVLYVYCRAGLVTVLAAFVAAGLWHACTARLASMNKVGSAAVAEALHATQKLAAPELSLQTARPVHCMGVLEGVWLQGNAVCMGSSIMLEPT
jgi:hypothetical protein